MLTCAPTCRNNIRETSLANNVLGSANTVVIDVPQLTLGLPSTNSLYTGSEQVYKVQVPAGQTLALTLTSSSSTSANEMYVRYGQIPDLGNYDFAYDHPLAANQRVLVPTTPSGLVLRPGSWAGAFPMLPHPTVCRRT